MINILIGMCSLMFIIIVLEVIFTLIRKICFGWTKVICEVIAADKDYAFIVNLKGTDIWTYPNCKYQIGTKILVTIDNHKRIKKIQMI